MNSRNQPEPEESQPVGQINYFNVLAQSIQHINDAIMNEKDPRDAAENLITDLPSEWVDEIREIVDKSGEEYNIAVDKRNKILNSHAKGTIKWQAEREFHTAGKIYSRNVKQAIITLLKKKNLLFPTRKEVPESHFVDMHDRKEKDDEEDINI